MPKDSLLLERVSLQDYPLATCNDGTSAVYYRHLESPLPDSEKMLVYLKGGGFCVPFVPGFDCEKRCEHNKDLCSARTEQYFDMNHYGQFSRPDPSINPAFFDFEKGNLKKIRVFFFEKFKFSICSLLQQ